MIFLSLWDVSLDMAFIIDYITALDVSKLRASEVSQCLLYLEYVSKRDPKVKEKITLTRDKLNKRLQELREEKDSNKGR